MALCLDQVARQPDQCLHVSHGRLLQRFCQFSYAKVAIWSIWCHVHHRAHCRSELGRIFLAQLLLCMCETASPSYRWCRCSLGSFQAKYLLNFLQVLAVTLNEQRSILLENSPLLQVMEIHILEDVPLTSN